jgi:hypothetical protein
MSKAKIDSCGFYETSYGRQCGYNSRAQAAREKYFENNWKNMYPSAELLRRQNVSKLGYDRMAIRPSCRDLYPRSSHVRASINDQLGLLGPTCLDTQSKALKPRDHPIYERAPCKDSIRTAQLPDYVEAPSSGSRALMPNVQPTTHLSERILPVARWNSRKTAERIPGFRPANYDTQYTDDFSNINRLDNSGWMRNSALGSQETSERAQLPPSRTFNEATQRRAQTAPGQSRTITHAKLWDMHPTQSFIQNSRPESSYNPRRVPKTFAAPASASSNTLAGNIQ